MLGVVSHNFRPEFINRIDEVVVFHPLGEKHIASIAHIQLQRLYRLFWKSVDMKFTSPTRR
ncbi:hypothetical protein AB3N44_18425 [Enterobacter chuandaensis]|uniref:hypothetical protein n=1 Tax=Enterobacter chuandaensis TaxID=2497875 RepID=UPI003877BE56